MRVMKPLLPDYLRLGHPWWLVVALFKLVVVVTAGCLPFSAPSATRTLTPTLSPSLEHTTPTVDRENATTAMLTPTSPPLESTTSITDTETVAIVSGYVVGGGDTTPEGLSDAPRRFAYRIRREDGSFIYVTYVAYPPLPFGDSERDRIALTFHAGTILIGDYLKARGSYEEDTNTLTVAGKGDYIETYPEKP